MTVSDADLNEFESARGRLFAIAYRMLGSVADAEDVVQESFLRWQSADRAAIRTPAAWLTKVVSNLALNRLSSSVVKREQYIGTWLPEPILDAHPGANPDSDNPESLAERHESVSFALLVMLERLSPMERVVFVLREAFGYRHAEIAQFLNVSESASQQTFHRAQERLGDVRRFEVAPQEAHRIAKVFVEAALSGDPQQLAQLLTSDVIAIGDGGGVVPAARRPFVGREKVASLVSKFFQAVPNLRQYTEGLRLYSVVVGGAPALLGVKDSSAVALMILDVVDGKISAVRTVANPNKLTHVYQQWTTHADIHQLPSHW
ncbi:RNA polymerase sigma factor SigJ [Natronoglycomyces albus]|uniref:RNA polymerase sigma factor SigJ n=1 Tax=Natronoglycomyces albus TaxID=2811108 RepID=A0A895XN48_9ACTN|nr:RNA polymerase sigma factor SigJ [Natronoglycomyces albus]QSB06547.1 RNA polymerase sigma factor SigJ [Natronoglycomyces albus]